MGSATKTVVELFGGTYRERGTFFVVKWAKAKQVGPTLSQLHVSPDDVYDINPGEQILYE